MRWGGGRQHPTRYPTTYQPLRITTRHQKPAIFTISTIPPFPESARHSLPVLTIFTIPRLARQYQPLCTRHFRHSHPSPPFPPLPAIPPFPTNYHSQCFHLEPIAQHSQRYLVLQGGSWKRTSSICQTPKPLFGPFNPPPPPRIAQAKKKNP